MTTRKVYSEGTYAHYVTFSCYKRRTLLQPDKCKRIIIGTLSNQLKQQNGLCSGFVVMPDHVHALVWFPQEHQISNCMDKWKELTSKQIAAIYEREFPNYFSKLDASDPIWQPRYYGFNIFSAKKVHEKVNY